MSRDVLRRRAGERDALLRRARQYAELVDGLGPTAVVVIGSVARGDFNKWSDIDVLVIVEGLPGSPIARYDVLRHGQIVGVQPIGWTTGELRDRRQRGDPIAVEADTVGVLVAGALPS